jgi:hypothetical protein
MKFLARDLWHNLLQFYKYFHIYKVVQYVFSTFKGVLDIKFIDNLI